MTIEKSIAHFENCYELREKGRLCDGCRDYLRHILRAAEATPDLLDALKKLRAEAHGFVTLADRETHGNTNIAVMRLRLSEALEAIAKAEGSTS